MKMTNENRVANSLLSQELKLCFSDTKCTKAPYTKKRRTLIDRISDWQNGDSVNLH